MADDRMHDLVIVGAGPAGLSASIYAARALLDCVTLEQLSPGGQVLQTSQVDNYPGLPACDGWSLVDAMARQAEELGARIESDQASAVRREADGTFAVSCSQGDLRARCVVLAAGATPRRAGFEGEDRFQGRGVSYCGTCDGMFYRGKEVFAVGGGNTAAEEALFLSRLCSKVTMLVRRDCMRAQAALVRELEEAANVEIRYRTSLAAIGGGDMPSWVTLRDNDTGAETREELDEGSFGVFVFVGHEPASSLVEGLADLSPEGGVVTDERMATRTPGLFCAGDVREKPLRQIVTACADGAVAATSAAQFLRGV